MTDISKDDEREAREWLQYACGYGPADADAKHRRTIIALLDAVEASQRETRTVPDDVVLTLVSQARQRARDAALEEAAEVANRWAMQASDADLESSRELGSAYDPNGYHAGYNCGACEYGVQIAGAIRALRSKPAAPSARDAALHEAVSVLDAYLRDDLLSEEAADRLSFARDAIAALRSKP